MTGFVKDLQRSGRPLILNSEEKENILEELQNSSTSFYKLAKKYDVSSSAISNIAHSTKLAYKKFEATPKLTEFHKILRIKKMT